MKKLLMHLLAAFLITTCMVTGCTKEPLNNITPEESRIYITNYDSSVNFGSFKTYSIADSAAIIDNGHESKALEPIGQAYIASVNKYMQQRGYTLVDKGNDPDIGININRIYNTSTGVVSLSDYWDYYGGYWDPYYWGLPGYGYYVPSYGVYQITEGAVSIDMLDLKDASTNGKIKVMWTGLIRGSGIFSPTTTDASVQALFDQSTYLKPTN